MLRFCCDWQLRDLMQLITEENGYVTWVCDECGGEIILPKDEEPTECGDD